MSGEIHIEIRKGSPVIGMFMAVHNGRGACGDTEHEAIDNLCRQMGFDGYEEVETSNEPSLEDLIDYIDEDGFNVIDIDSGVRHAYRGKYVWMLLDVDEPDSMWLAATKADAVLWVVEGKLP